MSRRAKREEGMLQNKTMIIIAILAVLVIAMAGAIIALRGRNKNVSKINEQVEVGKMQTESTENTESASSAIGNKLNESQKDNGESSNASNSANASTNENASNSSKISANENTSDLTNTKNTTNSGNTSSTSTENTGNSSSTSNKNSTANSNAQNSSNSSNLSATTNSENTSNKDEQTSKQQEKSKESKEDEKEPSFIKPVEGEVIKDFSKDNLVFSNTLQEWVTHLAVDIKADARDVVKCAADGTVTAIKNDPRYGLTVIVEHQAGFKTVYSNLLTAEFVIEGESVKQGQTLGTVGTSATFEIADESHLHFEMLKDSEYVNPGLYINF
ncbi:MAG: M23 family metallopeptidase [Clostridia bacterium]|nr:M23 family metallopeptidase [Clostridia bacterium]